LDFVGGSETETNYRGRSQMRDSGWISAAMKSITVPLSRGRASSLKIKEIHVVRKRRPGLTRV
jgi:hypothetical protein